MTVSSLRRQLRGRWGRGDYVNGSRTMKLPWGGRAIVDRDKLTTYCLNPGHPRGKHKARVFAAALGITAENVDELRSALLAAASTKEAQPTIADRFGDRYLIDFEFSGPAGTCIVRSLWILRRGDSAPRLTSCYVKQR